MSVNNPVVIITITIMHLVFSFIGNDMSWIKHLKAFESDRKGLKAFESVVI